MTIQFCAIDPSITCTALSILKVEDDKFILVDKVSLKVKGRYEDRWQKKMDMLELFEFYLKDKIDDIAFFVIENYSYGSVGQLADLGELGGLYKRYIYKNNKTFDVMAPKSVKKIITGNGNAGKKEVQEALAQYIHNGDGIVYNNLDESDSVAVGISYAIKMQDHINERKKD